MSLKGNKGLVVGSFKNIDNTLTITDFLLN